MAKASFVTFLLHAMRLPRSNKVVAECCLTIGGSRSSQRPRRRCASQPLARTKMKLLPLQTFDAVVNLPPWEVCRRLLENVGGTKPFHGDVQEESFKIHRNSWADPFRLRLHGVLESVSEGTRITIKMKTYMPMKLYVLFFMSVIAWLNFTGELTYGINLLVLAMLVFIYFVALRLAANEAKQAFLEFLENYIIANPRSDHDRA
jgi:hypothetical protein